MKLVASMLAAEVETGRYLNPCISHLLTYCDEVVVAYDGSNDWEVFAIEGDREKTKTFTELEKEPVDFYAHEGRARQRLLDVTLDRKPTHILHIDADEFVTDPDAILAACMTGQVPVGTLCMQEVWQAQTSRLMLRQDQGWEERDAPVLWSPIMAPYATQMPDKALACGRLPETLRRVRATCIGSEILHFGWACKADRPARHNRYVLHDQGRFHARTHLDSILDPDEAVTVTEREWPETLLPWKKEILARSNRKA